MLTATRREWNELYVFFALLGKGSVTLGDEEGKPSPRVLPIVRISRQEHDGKREYQVEKDEVHVTGGQMDGRFPREDFRTAAALILSAAGCNQGGGAASEPPEVQEDGTLLRGEVHDPTARIVNRGVSGNAGLFSTAREVARIHQMLLDKGVCGGRRYLTRATCELFTTLKSEDSRRGLGFDKPDAEHPDRSPCAAEAPSSVFGHTGYSGTAVWVDPDNGLVFVFLSNRTYPLPFERNQLSRLDIRPRMQQAMYQSIMR